MSDHTYTRIECVECAVQDEAGVNVGEHLAEFVRDELANALPDGWVILTVDGVDGVGKSALAETMGCVLKTPVVGLDDFLIPNQDSFLIALRITHIRDQLVRLLLRRSRIIVEGCLVLRVVERLAIQPDFRIYVLRGSSNFVDASEILFDEHDLLFSEDSADDFIRRKEIEVNRFSQLSVHLGEDPVGAHKLTGLKQENHSISPRSQAL